MLEKFNLSDVRPLNERIDVDPFKMPDISELPLFDESGSNEKMDSIPDISTLPPLDAEIVNKTRDSDISKNGYNTIESETQDVNDDIKSISCRNEALAGLAHPETGVMFEEKIVENADGEKVKGVFPVFESTFDAQLGDELLQASDKKQFEKCNQYLKEAVENNPDLKSKFSKEQLEQIDNGDTPDGYTWHHHEEKGKMQLVDTAIHNKTGHTGGKAIWGGGSEHR
ncbi:hypothetical protein BKG94_05580 [Rodentibacter ratti]|uniref:HNH endonuclease n=1 Tax=Rodentibacter ratti TaxID=1906745 RepID=UPI000986DF76|nr:HNH endonuclease [Rodentibacter ratti]OOF88612.1 hypothetical protein BKG94_05580 [Rodentibacter ratti]